MRRLFVSPSNERRLSEARAWLQATVERSQVLILAHTRRSADDFVRASCPPEGGLLGVHRITLLRLASQLAEAELVQRNLAPVSALGMQALAARSVQLTQWQHGLSYFDPVAQMPGFARALLATISDLRAARISPGMLRASGQTDRTSDLAALLQTYQEELASCGLADRTTLLVNATKVARDDSHPLLGLPLLLLDCPPETAVESGFVAALSERSPHVFATMLDGDREGVKALEDALSCAPELDDIADRTTLDRVRHQVFSTEVLPAKETDDSLHFFSGAGEGQECVEVARRILRAAGAGVPFDRMAILLRSPDAYGPLVADALARASIPAFFTQGARRPDPAGRALLALLACAREGLSAARFAEYLSLGQVPDLLASGAPPKRMVAWVPSKDDAQLVFATEVDEAAPTEVSPTNRSPVIGGTLQVPPRWEQLLVEAAVIGGLSRWEQRLRGLKAELAMHIVALEEEETERIKKEHDLHNLKNLERFALPIIGQLAALPERAHWSAWLAQLEALAGMSLRSTDSVAAVLAELRPMAEVGPVGLGEVEQVLRNRLSSLREEPTGDRYGHVFVGTIEEVHGRSFAHVFLPGLAEGIFPKKAFEDPLLLDEQRADLGPSLVRRTRRLARERSLLRQALGAAEEVLVASYPRTSVIEGKPRVPSFYALDLLRAASGRLPPLAELERAAAAASDARLGWPAPTDPKEAIDDAEYDLAVLGPLVAARSEKALGRGRYLIEDEQGADRHPHLGRALRSQAGRWRKPWTAVDGIVCDAIRDADAKTKLNAILDANRLTRRTYSPTSLQRFSRCPYAFLLYAIHRLRPREEVVAIEELDPLTRGSLFHEVQFQLFKALRQRGYLPLTGFSLSEEILPIADEVLDQTAARYQKELAPAIAQVWQRQIEQLRSDLHRWLRLVARDEEFVPAHAELAFGMKFDPLLHDDASVTEGVLILDRFRVRGSVDLVERRPFDGHLRATDHKTGRLPLDRPRQVGGGEHLQPLIYALALEQVLNRPAAIGQLFYCTQRGGYSRVEIPVDARGREHLDQVLSTIDLAIQNGFLVAAPRAGACRYCNYRLVCGPREEQRVYRKDPGPIAALNRLRQLP